MTKPGRYQASGDTGQKHPVRFSPGLEVVVVVKCHRTDLSRSSS